MPKDCLEKQLRAFQVTFGRTSGLAKILFGCKTFFLIFAFCHSLLPFSSHGKLLQFCGIIPQLLLCSPLTSGFHQKSVVGFFQSNYREKTAFVNSFDSVFLVPYLTHSCQLLEPRCFETAFVKAAASFC